MSTRAASALLFIAALLVASETSAAGPFDGRAWKVGYEAANNQESIREYVLPDERVEAWTELITRQVIFDPNHRIPVPRLLELIRAGFGDDCRAFKWTVLRESEAGVLYEWSHSGCADYPSQYEVSWLAPCQKGLCRWAYSTKRVPASAEVRTKWRAIVSRLREDGP